MAAEAKIANRKMCLNSTISTNEIVTVGGSVGVWGGWCKAEPLGCAEVDVVCVW